MNYSRITSWILPMLATVGWIPLLVHQSEPAVLFNRYSIQYAIMPILYGLNLVLFWRKSVRHVLYQRLKEQLSPGPLISLALVAVSAVFLNDFGIGIGLSLTPPILVAIVLLGVLLLQVKALRGQLTFALSHLALITCSVALTVILIELIFIFFLLQTRTPKSEKEFLQLMAFNRVWPQPISISKPPGVFRILGLSDSFGIYGGTTSNYHYLLEDMLRHDVSPRIQMVNVSVPAYSPLHELALLRFAMPYSPDLVLHGFFVGNDFSDYGGDSYTYRNIPAAREAGGSPYRPRRFLIAKWIYNALERLQEERQRRREQVTGKVDELGALSNEAFLKMQYFRMNKWGRRGEKDLNRMKETLPVIDAIRSSVEQGGAQYVMVIHPDETQANDKLRQKIITTFQVNEDEYDFDLPQKLLRSYCAEKAILCLDLLPIFRAKAEDGDLYLLRDTHYNHAGHELAAASISQFLNDRQLLRSIGRKTSGQTNPAQ